MLLSWLRPRPKSPKRPASFRPTLESLDERIVPAAHFNSATSAVNNAGALVVSFKEAGLGDTTTVNYDLTVGNASAEYAYVNKAGHLPNSPNFSTSTGPLEVTGTFTSGKNGQITASLTADPPPAPADFVASTPNGLHVAIVDVVYSNITLTDTTNSLLISLPDAQKVFIPT